MLITLFERIFGVSHRSCTKHFCSVVLSCLISANLAAREQPVDAFPEIDQRTLPAMKERCGSIALASWVIWLSENGIPKLATNSRPKISNNTGLGQREHAVLHQIDSICGGSGEIKLLRLIEGFIEYLHDLPNESLRTVIHYYNLPQEALLKQLYNQNASVILLYGIYDGDPSQGDLHRVAGHYTCLVGYNQSKLIGNTYAQNYAFNLEQIPMERLARGDQYQSRGTESLVYMHYPSDQFQRYTFRSYAPVDAKHALQQISRDSPAFFKPDQTVLLEGAISIWITQK